MFTGCEITWQMEFGHQSSENSFVVINLDDVCDNPYLFKLPIILPVSISLFDLSPECLYFLSYL